MRKNERGTGIDLVCVLLKLCVIEPENHQCPIPEKYKFMFINTTSSTDAFNKVGERLVEPDIERYKHQPNHLGTRKRKLSSKWLLPLLVSR